jgi:hypothetical protein
MPDPALSCPAVVPASATSFTASADELFTFVYGSDMHPDQISAICSRPETVCLARLADHRLSFHGYAPMWDGAVETVAPEPGSEVWGVLHRLTKSDAQRLDAWHDARLDGSGPYFHFPAMVTDLAGTPCKALLYKKDILGPQASPSREYLDFIREGARLRGAPESCLAALAAVVAHAAGYPVPLAPPSGLRRLGGGDSCSACGGLDAR